jgi:hypothetical protein
MDRFPYTAEDREDKVCQLIDARIHAIKHDILIGRESTTLAVLDRMVVGDTEEEARAILWNAVVGGSCAVGVDNVMDVVSAIYFEAEALAEKDVADMERRRADSERDRRIEQRVFERFFAHHLPA